MAALIPKGLRQSVKSVRGVMLLGVQLRDAREEVFIRMVVDGIALGIAYTKAGFQSDDAAAPSKLFALPRIQERAHLILEARRTTGVVSLGEVTDMLQRVFAGAHAAEEYSAAHNAALSLARIYGHVTDKATLEIIRRPSRDPDAPSEQALSSWVESLPALPSGPDFSHSVLAAPADKESAELPLRDAPASLLGLPADTPTLRDNLATPRDSVVDWDASHVLPTDATARDMPNDSNDLPMHSRLSLLNSVAPASDPIACDPIAPGRPENGAPARPVTGTPQPRARSPLSGKTGPLSGDEGTVYPSAEDLFG